MTNRDQRTIWTLYNKDKNTQITKLNIVSSKYVLPIKIFENRIFSILEIIVHHLISNYNLKPRQISSLLNKKITTIYSVIHRYKEKRQEHMFIKLKP